MQCAGKAVLVTGAQQGIGRAMALEFAAADADVATNWLGDERAVESVADIAQTLGARRESDGRVRSAVRFGAGVSPTSPRPSRPPGAERGDLKGCRSWIPIPHERNERNRRAPQ
jgi:NAD(P)-dependent dehydrogenase (short-subunit alcohol dehydrogenase family)